jgi:hypothetical protein
MRKTLLFFLLLLSIVPSVLGTLRITSFVTEIEILSTSDLAIVETLYVAFKTPHHGIEREIPVSYRRSTGENLNVSLSVDAIEQDGRSAIYTTRRSGRTLILRIGDPDRTITGTHTYTIRYTVGRALLFHKDYLQLYWNATGNEWRIPIDYAMAVVTLPPEVSPEVVSTTSYVGYIESTSRGTPAWVDEEGRWVFEAADLTLGEGLTIDVSIPREIVNIAPPHRRSEGPLVLGGEPVCLPSRCCVARHAVPLVEGGEGSGKGDDRSPLCSPAGDPSRRSGRPHRRPRRSARRLGDDHRSCREGIPED